MSKGKNLLNMRRSDNRRKCMANSILVRLSKNMLNPELVGIVTITFAVAAFYNDCKIHKGQEQLLCKADSILNSVKPVTAVKVIANKSLPMFDDFCGKFWGDEGPAI